MSYRTLQQWRQRGGSYVKTRTTVAEQTLLGRNSRVAARRQQDVSDRNGSCANLDLWQRLWQYSSNGCDNMVAEQNWFGGIVTNSNGSVKTSATVEEQTWLIEPGGSGSREAAATSRQERWQQNKLGLAATVGRQKVNSEMAVTATAVAQNWIC